MRVLDAGLADGVLDPLARLLGEMQAARVGDPARVVREVLTAGEDAVRWPLFAWAAGVNPVAILWAYDVRRVLVVRNVVGNEAATARAIEVGLDVWTLGRALAAMS
jgi:hypothetical protein